MAYRHFFIKEVAVIVEKEIPVTVVEKSQTNIYRLENDLYFDFNSGKLYKFDKYVKLTPLLAKLLQGFIEAESYRLSVNEIMDCYGRMVRGFPKECILQSRDFAKIYLKFLIGE